jgi:uroporphyrinogen-III synthase
MQIGTLRTTENDAAARERNATATANTPQRLAAAESNPQAAPMPARHESYTVVSLRPAGDHVAVRRAAAAHGWRTVALSPWRIAMREDAATRAALREALKAEVVIVASPAAARASARVAMLRQRRGQTWCAVGAGTAAALRRAGVAMIERPARMDSEGLLALPVLADVAGRRIGVLTAPGGRDQIAPGLQLRGAIVQRVDVYAREPMRPNAATLARLRGIRGRWLLPLSSGDALQHLLTVLPEDCAARLRTARVIAASERLAQSARALGCVDVQVGPGPRPRQLLDAAAMG